MLPNRVCGASLDSAFDFGHPAKQGRRRHAHAKSRENLDVAFEFVIALFPVSAPSQNSRVYDVNRLMKPARKQKLPEVVGLREIAEMATEVAGFGEIDNM